MGSSSPILGMKIPKICELPPPSDLFFFQDPFLFDSSGWQRLVKVDGMITSRGGGCRRCFILSGRDFFHELFCEGTSVRVMLRFTFGSFIYINPSNY